MLLELGAITKPEERVLCPGGALHGPFCRSDLNSDQRYWFCDHGTCVRNALPFATRLFQDRFRGLTPKSLASLAVMFGWKKEPRPLECTSLLKLSEPFLTSRGAEWSAGADHRQA